jgi:hypothetical protein
MATLQDLFKSKKTELYGKSEKIRIDTLGLINPPRAAALLASSPNTIADLIGNQVSGVLKGSANRPGDTIFKNNTVFAKPISLTLQNPEADTPYFIKKSPAPASVIAKIQQGASSPVGIAANIGLGLAKVAITKGGLKKLSAGLKAKSNDEQFGTKFGQASKNSSKSVLKEDKKFTEYYVGKDTKLKKREGATLYKWDDARDGIQNTETFDSIKDLKDIAKEYSNTNQVWVSFGKYGTTKVVPFVGAISGISEDISSEWSDFKYVGSPFKVYRYGGVERTLKFDLKLYYLTATEKDVMIRKINFLKSLAFPFDEVSMVSYAESNEFTDNTPTMFSPNLVHLNIEGLYNNILGIVDSIGFTIDDNTVWANNNPYMESDGDSSLYPSVVNVSISMKIIENHKINSGEGETKTYRYNFDGYNEDGKKYIETPKSTT